MDNLIEDIHKKNNELINTSKIEAKRLKEEQLLKEAEMKLEQEKDAEKKKKLKLKDTKKKEEEERLKRAEEDQERLGSQMSLNVHQQNSRMDFDNYGGSALSLNVGGIGTEQLESFAEDIKKEMAELINKVAKQEAKKTKDELASGIELLTKHNDEQK